MSHHGNVQITIIRLLMVLRSKVAARKIVGLDSSTKIDLLKVKMSDRHL